MLQNEPCVPRVVASGVLTGDGLNGSTAYFIISPFGQHLGSDVHPTLMHTVVHDVAGAIGAMELHGLVHRCVGWQRLLLRSGACAAQLHASCSFHDAASAQC